MALCSFQPRPSSRANLPLRMPPYAAQSQAPTSPAGSSPAQSEREKAHQVGVQVLERALAGHEGLEAGEGNMVGCHQLVGWILAAWQPGTGWATTKGWEARPSQLASTASAGLNLQCRWPVCWPGLVEPAGRLCRPGRALAS